MSDIVKNNRIIPEMIESYRQSMHINPSYAQKVVDSEGEGHLVNATYHDHKCGCRITGCGNLQLPVTIVYCAMHAAAPELLKMVQEMIALSAEQSERIGKVIKDIATYQEQQKKK